MVAGHGGPHPPSSVNTAAAPGGVQGWMAGVATAAVTCRPPPQGSNSAAPPLVLLPHLRAAPAAAAAAAAAPLPPRPAASRGPHGEGRLLLEPSCNVLECPAAAPQRQRLLVGKELHAFWCAQPWALYAASQGVERACRCVRRPEHRKCVCNHGHAAPEFPAERWAAECRESSLHASFPHLFHLLLRLDTLGGDAGHVPRPGAGAGEPQLRGTPCTTPLALSLPSRQPA